MTLFVEVPRDIDTRLLPFDFVIYTSIPMCTLNGSVPIDILSLFVKFLGMNCFVNTTSPCRHLLFGRLLSHVSSHHPTPRAFWVGPC